MVRLSAVPLTPLGWSTAAGSALGLIVGWWLGWIEFLVFGLGCLVALAAALPFIIGSHELRLSREVLPSRVGVGRPARSSLAIENPTASTSSTRTILDEIGRQTRTIDVPSLGAGEVMHHRELLPTDARGAFPIGPARVTRMDPLGLCRRDFGESEAQTLWVHPDYRFLAPMRSGLAKDLESPTHDTSPAGDVAFHTLREYTPGDDVRQIHWMSTARTGQLMVRQNVDNRLPFLTVVVDARPTAISPEQFELALACATSLMLSAFAEERPIAIWVGDEPILSASAPANRDQALDRLAIVQQRPDAPPLSRLCPTARSVEVETSAIVIVSTASDLDDLLVAVSEANRYVGVVTATVTAPGAKTVDVPRSLSLPFADLDELELRWQQVAG